MLLNNKISCLKGTLISLLLVSGQNIQLDDEVVTNFMGLSWVVCYSV